MKDTILDLISKKEALRILNLTEEKTEEEYFDWFNESAEKGLTTIEMKNALYDDFMRYRQDDSVEELKEVLTRYI